MNSCSSNISMTWLRQSNRTHPTEEANRTAETTIPGTAVVAFAVTDSRFAGRSNAIPTECICDLDRNKTSCRWLDFPHALKVLDTNSMSFAYSYFLIAISIQ
jgi:hypothetical protein